MKMVFLTRILCITNPSVGHCSETQLQVNENNFHQNSRVNPYAVGTKYICFQANFRPINSTRISKMFCNRCLVNLIVTF